MMGEDAGRRLCLAQVQSGWRIGMRCSLLIFSCWRRDCIWVISLPLLRSEGAVVHNFLWHERFNWPDG